MASLERMSYLVDSDSWKTDQSHIQVL